MQRRKHSREFKLEAERDILKSRGPFCEGALVRFAFIAKHWEIWPVSWLWGARCLAKRLPRRGGLPKDQGERSIIAGNVLDRQFMADAPNRKWVADFTYIWTAEGWLYVAAVIDLFSRRVVGWSMQAEMTAQLVTDALIMAIWRRGKPDALLHHSDQG